MPNHVWKRGRSPVARVDPVEDAAQAYLAAAEGNPSAASRFAAADVVALDHLAAEIGKGLSWGFIRRRPVPAAAPSR